MATEARVTSQKKVCEEAGLEETNGKANAKAKRRAGVLLSSDDNSRHGGQFDVKNHLDKVEEPKLLLRMHQQLGCERMETKFAC